MSSASRRYAKMYKVLAVLRIFFDISTPMTDLLDFIRTYENGVTEEQILVANPSLTKVTLVGIINKYIKNNSVTLYKQNGKMFYKFVTNASDDYESLILSLISQSGSEGIWIRDIREKTNMPHNLVLKMLNSMENKQIIKALKNIKNNRKVYVLYDVVPSDDVTGGFWFADNDVDAECVENVSKIVYNYVSKKTKVEEQNCMNKYSNNVSLSEITDFINQLEFLNSTVKEADMRVLLESMVYEDSLERLYDEGIERYRAL